MRLKDQVAIVTGGGSGFGEGISKRFAQEGAKVIVNDLKAEGGERVSSEIGRAGGQAKFIKGDVSKDADWGVLVKATLDAYGKLDIVVNNAGTTHRNQPILNVTEEQFDRVYAVNVKSLFWSVRNCVPVFR
jgi:3-oxoacyl-[acyl-carrier protein] reductase